MKKFVIFAFLFLSLFASVANAKLVQIKYVDMQGSESKKNAAPYFINPKGDFNIAVSAGVGRKIVTELKTDNGVLIDKKTKERVENIDKFVIDGVTYFGFIFSLPKVVDGKYVLTVFVLDRDQAEISKQENSIIVDTQAPTIEGEFYWDTPYARVHDDGQMVVTLTETKYGGFKKVSAGLSGFKSASFTSEYVDGPNAGKKHAEDLTATLTNDGNLVIGTGVLSSISSAYVPSNVSSQMLFTYKITDKADNTSTKSVRVYVSTQGLATKPVPYALYTGVEGSLDNIPAFKGFIPYTPKMVPPANPVRMIYKVPRANYFGGGGNADIYGGWVNFNRNKSRIVHIDENNIFFDITGTSNGRSIDPIAYHVRDLSSWRRNQFEHDLALPEELKPPEVTQFSYYLENKAQWFSHPSSLTTYITKTNAGDQKDFIKKIRVSVKPRVYQQRFSYNFNHGAGRVYQGSCLVQPGEEQCLLDTNMPYPDFDINTYHNRHRVEAVDRAMFSNEIISNWMYDGLPATVIPESVKHDSLAKTIQFSVRKEHVTRIWSNAQIRSVLLNAVDSKNKSIAVKQTDSSSNQVSGTQINSYTFSYADLPDGKYDFSSKVEDGFSTAGLRNVNEHSIQTGIVVDTTPPLIKTNISGNKLVSLPSVSIRVDDFSKASITSVRLTGGIENVTMSVPVSLNGINLYRLEHVYIKPSDSHLYTLSVTSTDEYGNSATINEKFYYVPNIVNLPVTKQPAISSPLKSENGLPSNVIKTPQIKNSLGELAVGNHDVVFTLLPTAKLPMVINGNKVSPGESVEFTVNLSHTNHKLVFEAYPAVSGQEVTNQFEIHLSDIKVSLCPDLFTLDSGQCIHLSFTDPLLKCNNPYALVDGQCLFEVLYSPTTTCLNGYTLDGTICRGSYTVSPLTVCPPGYSLLNESTCKEVKTFALKVCPDGQTAEEGFCKDAKGNTSPQKQYCQGKDISGGSFCDDGICYDYKKDWNACQLSTTVPSTFTCQAGTLSSGVCQVTDQYQLNMQCPFGYNRDGISCKRIEIIPPNKSCPAGFDLAGNTCTKTESSPFLSCPTTHELVNGRCHKKEPIKITCPATYSWDGSACSRTDEEDATEQCPAGHIWNSSTSTCRKTDTQAANPVCETGYSWEQTQCKKTISIPATPVCKAGFVYDGTICSSTEHLPGILECESGFLWNGSTCTKLDSIAAGKKCSSGYSLNGNICEKTETFSANVICPSGYSFNGSYCDTFSFYPADYDCSGFMSTTRPGMCVIDVYGDYDGSAVCNPPYQRTSGGRCAIYEWPIPMCNNGGDYAGNGQCRILEGHVEPSYSCPDGQIAFGPQCSRRLVLTPSYFCDTDRNLNGDRCEKTISNDRVWSCPTGWNGSQHCSRTVTTPPESYVCDQDFNLTSQSCTKDVFKAPDRYTCPVDWLQQTDPTVCKLYTDVPAIGYSCDQGWILEGQMCRVIRYETETRTCGSTQTMLSSTTCYENVPSTSVGECPAGYTSNVSNCTKSLTEAVILSCNQNYELISQQCHITLEQSVTVECQPGEELRGGKCVVVKKHVPMMVCESPYQLDGTKCKNEISVPALN